METPVIFHLTTLDEWERAQDRGMYEPDAFVKDGFIHCSTESQLDGVLQRHFKHHENLVKLVIDPSRVLHPLKFEMAKTHEEEYPHIYGPLNLEAVTQIVFLDPITSEG